MTGKQLRSLRAKLGLTQKQLAEKLAVSSNTVARWERDEVEISEPIARLIRMTAAKRRDS
jgi:transcriptional regulator with XRE-family HTH domain